MPMVYCYAHSRKLSTETYQWAHTQTGITARVYNLHSYDAEKRAAFERWEAELVRIAAG